jgi:hypothetical protein
MGTSLSGSIVITSPVGNNYQYSINNGISYQSSATFNNVMSGNYSVKAKSSDGCVSNAVLVSINATIHSGIYHTSTTCSNYNNNRGELVGQMCYSSNAGMVKNVTPGMIYYYTKVVAPSASFCIDVLQSNSLSSFKLMNIHQTNQITLTNISCYRVATGATVSVGNGRICVSNATPGAVYILSVKYEPKSIIGSTFNVTSPICLYGFESRINGSLVAGSQTSIALKPDCNSSSEGNETTWCPSISGNPTTNNFIFNLATDDDQKISVRVIDVLGRIVDNFEMQPNEQTNRGSSLTRGVYFFEFIQGQNRKVLKGEKY